MKTYSLDVNNIQEGIRVIGTATLRAATDRIVLDREPDKLPITALYRQYLNLL